MGLISTSTPTTTVATGFNSIWNAVHHPLIFKGTRQDASIVYITPFWNGSAYVNRIMLNSTPPADFIIGSELTVVNGTKVETVVITAISGNLLTTTYKFTNYATGGLANVNSRKNYYVQCKVWGVNDVNVYYEIGLLDIKPLANGSIEINVNGFLKTIAEFTDSFKYNQINKKIVGAGSAFKIQLREVWKGFEGSFSSFNAQPTFFWVNATKQIKDPFNFNMGEFVLFQNYEPKYAKFISAFKKPTYFDGYPFSLTFINSDNVAGRQLVRKEQHFDINGASIGTASNNLINDQNLSVNRLKIKQGYSSAINEIDVWLEDGGVGTITSVATGYVSPGYGASVNTIYPKKV